MATGKKSSGWGCGLTLIVVLLFGWSYLVYDLTGLNHTCNSTLACGSKYNPATTRQDAAFAAFGVLGPLAVVVGIAGLVVVNKKNRGEKK